MITLPAAYPVRISPYKEAISLLRTGVVKVEKEAREENKRNR